jgi:drug/metabolite transporter (DMT)-like permease
MFLVVLLYAMFASVFTIAKTGLEYTQPFFLVGSRMLVAGVLMLGYIYFFDKKNFKFSKSHLWLVLRLGLFNIYLTNALEFWGLKYLTSFKTCFIYSLSPFVSAILSYFIFSERMSLKKWVGLTIGCLGFAPILLSQTSMEEQTGHFLLFSWAEIAVVGAAVSSVYGWILLKQLVDDKGYSPLMANGLSMLIGGSIALLHSSITENWDPIPVSSDGWIPFLECAGLLIIISSLICYNLYGYLLRKYTATFMSFAGFTTPLFTALFGWVFLNETVTWPFYISAGIVFVGLLIFNQEELKGSYRFPAKTEPEVV